MPMITFDKRVAVYRTQAITGQPGRQGMVAVYKVVAAAIVPMSSFDTDQPYATEATHVLQVPHWVRLNREDEIRFGRRPTDAAGNINPFVFVVKGRRRFDQTVEMISYYVREKE